MAIRNNHWYNLNEQRDYPVDDTASALSDDGSRLPSSLIADLRLRWPSALGRYAFISAAAVTPRPCHRDDRSLGDCEQQS